MLTFAGPSTSQKKDRKKNKPKYLPIKRDLNKKESLLFMEHWSVVLRHEVGLSVVAVFNEKGALCRISPGIVTQG